MLALAWVRKNCERRDIRREESIRLPVRIHRPPTRVPQGLLPIGLKLYRFLRDGFYGSLRLEMVVCNLHHGWCLPQSTVSGLTAHT